MRKILSLTLAIMMVFSMTIMASADNTITLTTKVPDAEYTLNIPAQLDIKFGTIYSPIGNITITDSKGFANGKNLKLSVAWNDFSSETVSTTIPFHLCGFGGGFENVYKSGDSLIFVGQSDGTVSDSALMANKNDYTEEFKIKVTSENWGKALGGEYTSVKNFSGEIVVE
jgi:type 1 fimbria pilin